MDEALAVRVACAIRGADGLVNPTADCCCHADDLAPCCDGITLNCQFAHLWRCPHGHDQRGDYDWIGHPIGDEPQRCDAWPEGADDVCNARLVRVEREEEP